jgi:hypothetical protein
MVEAPEAYRVLWTGDMKPQVSLVSSQACFRRNGKATYPVG